MAGGSFGDRILHLISEVGDGDLTGSVTVDQVYAKYQELREDLAHPRGGQAHYLRDSVYADGHMRKLANGLLTTGGSEIVDTMTEVVEDISDLVEALAPVEYNDLRQSGAPKVLDAGTLVYSRTPKVPRLTDAQLRAKRQRGEAP